MNKTIDLKVVTRSEKDYQDRKTMEATIAEQEKEIKKLCLDIATLKQQNKELAKRNIVLAGKLKSCLHTDQSIESNHNNTNTILAPNEDFDNNEVYDITTGETIKDI